MKDRLSRNITGLEAVKINQIQLRFFTLIHSVLIKHCLYFQRCRKKTLKELQLFKKAIISQLHYTTSKLRVKY